MTGKNYTAPSHSLRLLKRISALVLLLFLAHGAIAGAAHSHGKTRRQVVGQDSRLNGTVVGSSKPTSGPTTTPGECLVCRLHRNLYAGLLSEAPHTTAPTTQFVFLPTSTQPAISRTSTPRRGRAPPIFIS